jgi:hypothetical protein
MAVVLTGSPFWSAVRHEVLRADTGVTVTGIALFLRI